MQGPESDRVRMPPSVLAASAVAGFVVQRFEGESCRVAIPRPEVQIVVRYASGGNPVDVHALGTQRAAHRKHIRRGQWAISARLRLGTCRQVLGVPASELAACIVPLEHLWGGADAQRFLERLAGVSDSAEAVRIVDGALVERLPRDDGAIAPTHVALQAAEQLRRSKTVGSVARDLGVSERQLRRVFRETIGVGPKQFARMIRFHRALHLAREAGHDNWANVAADAGYYDQSHLIEEFRAIGGATPGELLRELPVF